MEVDDLTVPHRRSHAAVYRLAGCSQFYFDPPEPAGALTEHVWEVTAECLGLLDEVNRWIGPLDTRPRALGDLEQVRDALRRDRAPAWAQFDSVALRAFSQPDPPRQQFSLVLPAPGSRQRFASLVMGERPSTLRRNAEAVVERVLRHASALQPHVGLVGFGLMSEPWMEPHHVESAWPYLERYPGLQLPYQLEWGADEAGIPGIDWLTVLGERPLALLGGPTELRQRLEATAEVLGAPTPQVLDYACGVVVRACETPQLGDAETEGAPAGYRTVDAALRPLRWDGRSTRPSALLKVREKANGITPAEATRLWAARFE